MTNQQQSGLRANDPRADQLPLSALAHFPHRHLLERRSDNQLHAAHADAARVDIAVGWARFGADTLPFGFFSLPEAQFSCSAIPHLLRLRSQAP